MVLWQSPDTLVMSVFTWACGFECALSSACLVSCWSMVLHAVRVLMAVCIHVVMSCVKTWLVSFLISCVFVSCFAHGWWFVCWPCACVFVLCEHVASVLVFCVPCALCQLSWPTHLVSWLLVNLPHLSCLDNLLICSLYNLLVFAVPCQFVIVSPLMLSWWYPVMSCLPCPVLPCHVLPFQACQLSWFSPTG